MTPLRQALADYLRLRRSLGYRLQRSEKLLLQYIDHLEAIGDRTITIENALTWARLPANGESCWWTHRLSVVRGFATYLGTLDPATEIPPTDLLPWRRHRASPYLYSDQDIAALIKAAAMLRWPLRVVTYQTLIGLLAVTGMRVGEAISLDVNDLDLDRGVLVVRRAKFNKTREIPLHPTTIVALRHYLTCRRRRQPPPATPALFITPAGTRLLYCNVQWTFQRLVQKAGLGARPGSSHPRIHDLRHSFAVRTLLDAYQLGDDPERRLALLSTYLGHVNPAASYWYLSAAPELLSLAAERLDRDQADKR